MTINLRPTDLKGVRSQETIRFSLLCYAYADYYNVLPLTHTFRRCMKEYEDAGITVSDKFTTLIILGIYVDHYKKIEIFETDRWE